MYRETRGLASRMFDAFVGILLAVAAVYILVALVLSIWKIVVVLVLTTTTFAVLVAWWRRRQLW